MNDHLRDRILRRLDALNDERGYQVLDYVEFLESKYAERQSPSANVFTKLTEAVEDNRGAGCVSARVIAETMGFHKRASPVLKGARAAGKAVGGDRVKVAPSVGGGGGGGGASGAAWGEPRHPKATKNGAEQSEPPAARD